MSGILIQNFTFFVGIGLLFWRLRPRRKARVKALVTSSELPPSLDELAILIPARNEETSLPLLLESLKPAQKAGATILVIDDQSTDRTREIALSFGVSICQTKPKPHDWSGKNWACQKGFEELQTLSVYSKIRYLLFTDADTIHNLKALPEALQWFKQQKAALMTARPYHRSPSFWEQLLGPFYLMILFITNAKEDHPTADRVFSIGQFLLFQKDFYSHWGGHSSVRGHLAEDLALARLCFQNKKPFVIYPKTDLYSTRMYSTPKEFFKGWERNFRLGMEDSSWQTRFEIIFLMGAVLGHWAWWNYLLVVVLLSFLQKKEGRFHLAGAILYPVALMSFIVISMSAMLKRLINKPILWKSREYYR